MGDSWQTGIGHFVIAARLRRREAPVSLSVPGDWQARGGGVGGWDRALMPSLVQSTTMEQLQLSVTV